MKEFLFQMRKKFLLGAGLKQRQLIRLFKNKNLNRISSFQVPIVINNRNRVSYLKLQIDWFIQNGYHKLYVLDNDSDYQPLLDYYKHIPAKVIFLGKNIGYKALWQTDFFKSIKQGYYVYTDADLIPNDSCPKDLIYRLYLILKDQNIEKCGPALKIDDLPDYYEAKDAVISFEKSHWAKEIKKDVFEAPIDTTFALYKPYAKGDAEECKAFRVGGTLIFKHLPWYENSSNLDEEAKYYKEHVSSSSFWYNKKWKDS